MLFIPTQGISSGTQHARPTVWDDPQRVLLYASLVLALVGGFGLGAYMVLGFSGWLPIGVGIPALMQVHGQVQTIGFLVLFILAVAVQLFPRFHNTPLRHARWITTGGLIVGVGVLLRAMGQPLASSAARSVLLLLSALSLPAGLLLALLPLAGVILRGENERPRGLQLLLPLTAAGSLAAASALNVLAVVRLAAGAAVVPPHLDEAILHLQLWGFATTLVLAVSGRMYPRLLLLQPTRERLVGASLLLWSVGTVGVALSWWMLSGFAGSLAVAYALQAAGAFLYVAALRLFERQRAFSPVPAVTLTLLPLVRIAYGFLLIAVLLNVAVTVADLMGASVGIVTRSAVRHLLAQGFLLPILVAMAALLLNGLSLTVRAPRLLTAMVLLLFLGATLRAGAELIGGYAAGWGTAVAFGGLLSTGVFVVFSLEVFRSYRRGPVYRQ